MLIRELCKRVRCYVRSRKRQIHLQSRDLGGRYCRGEGVLFFSPGAVETRTVGMRSRPNVAFCWRFPHRARAVDQELGFLWLSRIICCGRETDTSGRQATGDAPCTPPRLMLTHKKSPHHAACYSLRCLAMTFKLFFRVCIAPCSTLEPRNPNVCRDKGALVPQSVTARRTLKLVSWVANPHIP